MNNAVQKTGLEKTAYALLFLSFFIPVIGLIVEIITGDKESSQYAPLTLIMMAIYSAPLWGLSAGSLALARKFHTEPESNTEIIFQTISAIFSTILIIGGGVWIFGIL